MTITGGELTLNATVNVNDGHVEIQASGDLTITSSGNVPDAREPPSGCRFRDRCPHAFARCAEETPALRTTDDGHRVACHLEG